MVNTDIFEFISETLLTAETFAEDRPAIKPQIASPEYRKLIIKQIARQAATSALMALLRMNPSTWSMVVQHVDQFKAEQAAMLKQDKDRGAN